MKYIYTIETTFQITGRGCVIVATFDRKTEALPNIKIGIEVILKKPNGEIIESLIKGIEMIKYMNIPERIPLALLLTKNIKHTDIPSGTKLYSK